MKPPPPTTTVLLRPHRLVRDLTFVMIWSAVVVVLLDVWLFLSGTIASYSLAGLFDATSELGLSSWIAVTQASLTAVTVWGLVLLHRSGESRLRFWGWTVLAVFFTYLALDDGTHLHERIGVAFGESGASSTGIAAAFPSYSWQFLLGPFFAAMGMFTLLFLWREVRDPRLRWRFVSALALLGLAVAMDFVEGLEEGSPLNLYARLCGRIGRWTPARPRWPASVGSTKWSTCSRRSKRASRSSR